MRDLEPTVFPDRRGCFGVVHRYGYGCGCGCAAGGYLIFLRCTSPSSDAGGGRVEERGSGCVKSLCARDGGGDEPSCGGDVDLVRF